MRTLDSSITTAQQSRGYKPYVELLLTSRSGATSLTYDTLDSPNRILRVRTAEGLYGESLFEVRAPGGQIIPISCHITLRDADSEFDSRDLHGYKVQVRWGFESYWDGSSNQSIILPDALASEGEPYFVFTQRDTSIPGDVITELYCISAWTYLNLQSMAGTGFGDVYNSVGRKIRHVLMDALTRRPSKVFNYDSSLASFSDITSAVEADGTDTVIEIDQNDILYIGVADEDAAEFDVITIELAVEASRNMGFDTLYLWEYSTAAGWSSLSVGDNLADGSGNIFENGQDADNDFVPKVITLAKPSDWGVQTINSETLRWIRATQTIATSIATKPQIRRLRIQRHWGMEITDADGLEDSATLAPVLAERFDLTRLELLRRLLDLTKLAVVVRQSTNKSHYAFWFDFFEFEDSPASPDYSYDLSGAHKFFAATREQTSLVPNKIITVNVESSGPSIITQFTGEAEDTDEQDAFGEVVQLVQDSSITSTADADALADRRLDRVKQEIFKGEFEVPMNVGQEPWDWISVTDTRTSTVITGRVGRILREYNQQESQYRMMLSLGLSKGLAGGVSLQLAKAQTQIRGRVYSQAERNATTRAFLPEMVQFQLSPYTPRSTSPPTLPGVPNVPDFMGFDLDAGPFSYQPVPFMSGYSVPKYSWNPNSLGQALTNSDVVRLRDFSGNGYEDILIYNDGTGKLIIEGAGNGTSFTLSSIAASLELLTQAEIRFRELSGTNYVGFKAASSLAGNQIWTLPSADGSSGQALITNGGGVFSFATPGGALDYQEYTSNQTWAKPAGATVVMVEAIGGGGGGGGGASTSGTNVTVPGGGGGGGGARIIIVLNAADLGATVSVTVGSGGGGGVGGLDTGSPDSGGNGSAGDPSTFGNFVTAGGGGGGEGGQAGSGPGEGGGGGGTGGSGSVSAGGAPIGGVSGNNSLGGGGGNGGSVSTAASGNAEYGGGGGGLGYWSTENVAYAGGSSLYSAGAGGGGGGKGPVGGPSTFKAGQAGGNSNSFTPGGGGVGGSSDGANGSNGATTNRAGQSGGGGGGGLTGNAGKGGDGALPGGGGGGGGGGSNNNGGGDGGDGANGRVRVWTL